MDIAAGGISMVRARAVRLEGIFHEPVPDKLCRAHLEKVAASATFARAGQLRMFLTWLGERSLAGMEPATEREIGETVFHRKDFDPQADSLVRKEMSRLREKLMQYYTREGSRDRVQIRYRGGYALGFGWKEPASAESPDTHAAPCFLILPLRSSSELSHHSVRFAEELGVRLGELGGTNLVSPTTALSYVGRKGDVREFASECGADFVIEGSLEAAETQLRATVWFVDGRSGMTEKPGRFVASSADSLADQAIPWVRERMVRLRQ
jgi:TolB-like protein